MTLLKLLCLVFVMVAGVEHAMAAVSRTISGETGTIVEGQTFTNTGDGCLFIENSTNITVRNNKFINCYGIAVQANAVTGLLVEYNYFDKNMSGVHVTTGSSNINIQYNVIKNSDAKGGARGQCVQFNGVQSAGNRVNYNSCIFKPGVTLDTNDGINMFNSGGTVADPLQIVGNYIEGWTRAVSAGGIIVGDNGGDYILVKENVVSHGTNAHIGVTGGNHITVTNNATYGLQTKLSNIGITAYAGTGPCDDITVTNNTVWNIHNNGTVATYYLPTSGGSECTNRTYSGNVNAQLYLTTNPLPFKDRVAAPPGPTYARDTVYWRQYRGPNQSSTVTHYHVYTCTPAPDCTIDGTGTIQAEVTLTPGQVMSWTLPSATRGRVRVYGANSGHTNVSDEHSNYLNFDTITPLPARNRAINRTAR